MAGGVRTGGARQGSEDERKEGEEQGRAIYVHTVKSEYLATAPGLRLMHGYCR